MSKAKTTKAAPKPDGHQMPDQVKLAAPYAFYEDDGTLRSWGPGQVVEDAAEIALLVERGAPFEAE